MLNDAIALTVLGVLFGLLVLCIAFFIFEKPLRHLFFKLSDRRFQRRTGIDPTKSPNPFL